MTKKINKGGRSSFLTIVLGVPFTGKTEILKKIILSELKKGSRALILTPDYAEYLNLEEAHPDFPERLREYKGAKRIVAHEDNIIDKLKDINNYYNKGLLVLDDCGAYLNANTHSALRRLLIRRRHRMIDIIIVAHGAEQVPPAFFTFASNLIMFKTLVPITVRRDKLINIKKWVEIQERVNREAEKNIHYYEIHKV